MLFPYGDTCYYTYTKCQSGRKEVPGDRDLRPARLLMTVLVSQGSRQTGTLDRNIRRTTVGGPV